MLKYAGGVGHPIQMFEAECWKGLGLSINRPPWRKTPSPRLKSLPRFLEDSRVVRCHLGPNHSPAHEVSLLPHGVPPGFVGKKFQHTSRDGFGVAERNKHATVV